MDYKEVFSSIGTVITNAWGSVLTGVENSGYISNPWTVKITSALILGGLAYLFIAVLNSMKKPLKWFLGILFILLAVSVFFAP